VANRGFPWHQQFATHTINVRDSDGAGIPMTAITRFAASLPVGMGGQREVSLGSCAGVVTERHRCRWDQLLRSYKNKSA
jgi:hypothetical protein